MSRILYLHQHFSTPEGATATRAFAQARALAAAGHRVTLACGGYAGARTGLDGPFRHGRRDGRVANFEVVEFDIPYDGAMGLAARSIAFARFAARATPLARDGWDLVVASSTPLTAVVPALLSPAPFLFEMRDPWPELPAALGLRARPVLAGLDCLADAACRRAAVTVALSDGMAELARRRGARDVEMIGQGCDLDLFGPQVAPWRPPEAAPGELLATYAGAHGVANGLDALLDAAALLHGRGERRIRLVLAGEGPERARLMARATPNVTFLPALPKRELAGLLAGSQAGLLCLAPVPEFAEWTAPNKLMDLLAAGLPVVSNVPGAAARLLAEAGCGETLPPEDPEALAEVLQRLAQHPVRRALLGAAARKAAVRRHDRRLLTARFVAACERAMAPEAGAWVAA
ncbi:glycosyltransferase family 4 protein [Roseococcus sp. DSY-14]|uniref:glycosyltransferase family 4 protein n=1 Tax=Roseococcus sp. DSY-14 TaxID=3369650 RepID=UPI00387AB1A1